MRARAWRTDIIMGTVLATVLTLTALSGIVITQEWRRTPPLPWGDLVKPPAEADVGGKGLYVFEPRKDMTAYELALSLQAIYGGPYAGSQMKPWYDRMPPEVGRHWRWIEPGPAAAGGVSSAPAPQEAPRRP